RLQTHLVGHCETPTPVVQEPQGLYTPADGPVGDSVRFEVVLLSLIHGNQNAGGLCLLHKTKPNSYQYNP
ncbi:MAG: hypothetical protein ACKO9W_14230, partial [Bacteroidota bacterium]